MTVDEMVEFVLAEPDLDTRIVEVPVADTRACYTDLFWPWPSTAPHTVPWTPPYQPPGWHPEPVAPVTTTTTTDWADLIDPMGAKASRAATEVTAALAGLLTEVNEENAAMLGRCWRAFYDAAREDNGDD